MPSYASTGGYLACIDEATKEIRWELTQGGKRGKSPFDVRADSSHVFVNSGGRVNCHLPDSGELLWSSEALERFVSMGKESFYSDTGGNLVSRARDNGAPRWSLPYTGPYILSVAEDGDRLAVLTRTMLIMVNRLTGEPIWTFLVSNWLGEQFPKQTEVWAVYKDEEEREFGPVCSMGPLVGDALLLGTPLGLLLSVDAPSGEVSWMFDMAQYGGGQVATILRRGDDVVLNRLMDSSAENCIFVLGAADGELRHKTKKSLTRQGSLRLRMFGSVVVGGFGHLLAGFDLDTQRMLWTFSHPDKVDVFYSGGASYGGTGTRVISPEAQDLLAGVNIRELVIRLVLVCSLR